jgi:ornithine cyclodeaminase
METLIINQSEVSELLPMDECIDVMERALKSLAHGKDILPLRSIMWLPEKKGALGLMPAYSDDLKVMGVKVVSVFPGNEGTEYDSHLGTVMLYEAEHGRLLAIIDASEITGIRTAATSGVATRLLAKENAGSLAILGSGVQARQHLAAMLAVRKIKRISVWSRTSENARRFAKLGDRGYGISIDVKGTAEAAVKDADIICTTTASPEPILYGKWITPGTHINAVGSSVSFARELDTEVVVKSRLFVDRRESTLNEAGDFLMPKKEGAIGDDHIVGEIGEILTGKVEGRKSPADITLFKSLGLAVEDVTSAEYIYRRALEKGIGKAIEIGGSRHSVP